MRFEDYKFVSWQINNDDPSLPVKLDRSIIQDIDAIAKPISVQHLVIYTGFSRGLYNTSVFEFDRGDFRHFLFSDESRNRLWNWLNEWRR